MYLAMVIISYLLYIYIDAKKYQTPNTNVYTVNIVIVRYIYNDKAYRHIYRVILYTIPKSFDFSMDRF